MNYYKQGDAANADKIRAAFEKLGYDTSRHLFNAKSVLYFTLNGEIRATTCNCTPAIIKTHPDYKELELRKIVEPKFKVGQTIWPTAESQLPGVKVDVIGIDTDRQHYVIKQKGYVESALSFKFQDNYCVFSEPKPHYDIANLQPFDKVLVRDSCTASWNISLFGCMGNRDFVKKFRCLNAHWFQCIPFNDDTKHLLGTTEMCPEEYVNW